MIGPIRKSWGVISALKGVIFLVLINIAFGALVKAWMRGTIKSNNAIGLWILLVPMTIMYGFVLYPLWAAINGKAVAPKALRIACITLLVLVISFIGGFYIDVDF